MKIASALIVAAGAYNLAFALFHLLFWRLFHWPEQLPKLTVANAGIMQVMNLCLTYLFVVCGAICLWFGAALVETELGRFVLLALAGFWFIRTVYQPMFFGLTHPCSRMLFVIFIAGTAIHGAAWWLVRSGQL
jgi:hypothetical protein